MHYVSSMGLGVSSTFRHFVSSFEAFFLSSRAVEGIRGKQTDMASSSSTPRSPHNIFGLAHTFSVRKTSPPLSAYSVDTVKGHHSPTYSVTESIMESYSTPLEDRPATKSNIQHIDRKGLYTDLGARVKYLHSFLDFNSGRSPISTSNVEV